MLLRLDAAPKALAWTRDGSLLLAGGDAPAPIRFDCRGGTPMRLAELPGAGHRGAVVQIAVAADGSSAWTASQDGSCRCWALGDNDDRGGLVHALNCARTGGRVVGVAVDEAALGLDAYGERRARQRVATATADGALRLWPAPQSAVSEADAKLIEVAANGDEALSMVSAALLKGGDGNSDVDAAAAASGLLPIVRAVARRVPRKAPCYVGKGAAAENGTRECATSPRRRARRAPWPSPLFLKGRTRRPWRARPCKSGDCSERPARPFRVWTAAASTSDEGGAGQHERTDARVPLNNAAS